MSNVRFALRVVCLFSVLSAIALHGCDARGARGGGFRSSFRSSSSSSYRSTSLSRSFRSSSLRRGTSPFTRSNWVMNAALIYGATRYMRSRRYYDHPDDMPTVCDNRYDDSPNGTVYGYFICPREGEDDDMDYCCGPDQQEYCCRFADSPGRVAGIVIGCLAAVAVVSVCVFLLCRWKGVCAKKKTCGSSGAAVHYQVSSSPAPYSTTVSKQVPYSTTPGKEPLPEGDVSNAWGTNPYPPYPPPEGANAPPGYDNPPMYPPPPTFPPGGPESGPPGTYPSQPPPPYGFNQ